MFSGIRRVYYTDRLSNSSAFSTNFSFFVNQPLFYLKVLSVTVEAASPPAAAKLLDKDDIFNSISIIFFRSVVFQYFPNN